MANSHVYKYTPPFKSLTPPFMHNILQKLKPNKDNARTDSVKWNNTVVLNRDKYIKDMTECISDKQKLRKLKEDRNLKRERALQRTLREINRNNILSDIEYSKLYSKGPKST